MNLQNKTSKTLNQSKNLLLVQKNVLHYVNVRYTRHVKIVLLTKIYKTVVVGMC